MAKYQPIYSKAWSDPWFSELKPSAKLLFLYLLTSPLNTPTGIYQCLVSKMAFDTGLVRRQVTEGLADLAGHVEYDEGASLVWVVGAAKYWPKNEGVLKAMQREVGELKTHPFAQRFLDRYPMVGTPLVDHVPTPEETVTETESTQEDSNSESETESSAGAKRAPSPTPRASPDGVAVPCGQRCPCQQARHIRPGVRFALAEQLGYPMDGPRIRKLLHGEVGNEREREALRRADDGVWSQVILKIDEPGAEPKRNPRDGSIKEGWVRAVMVGIIGA
jgi:hypothetical protein